VCDRGVRFRVWAPRRTQIEVVLERTNDRFALEREPGGYFSGVVSAARAGDLYHLLLDGSDRPLPDPASRFQPAGVHGPSQVIDPRSFTWKNHEWRGIDLARAVLYELHVGCFTPEGTWAGAAAKLSHLRDTGITVIEVMPVNEFAGQFGWGYDGVQWFAPTHLYGTPDDFRQFVDTAHSLGLGVILDVVYNHFGPTGNYAGEFSPFYAAPQRSNEWGGGINFDGDGAAGVREFVIQNAVHWIDEYHLDGLRLDATQAIHDQSSPHILAEISTACRAAAPHRKLLLTAENESQDVRHLEPTVTGGFGLDALWNDDFHHAFRVAGTGQADGYLCDYGGSASELLAATLGGFLYQGQRSTYQQKPRGTSVRLVPLPRFIHCLQNHDQVANSRRGERWTHFVAPGVYRALTTLWLLGPGTPLFFMGQEFASRSRFVYFADHEAELAPLVREGRWRELRRFARIAADLSAEVLLPDPGDRQSFLDSHLDWSELDRNANDWRLHRDLLKLRREDPVLSRCDRQQLSGAVINPQALLLRWFADAGNDRLLLVNWGGDTRWKPAAEPLLAPPLARHWQRIFSSDDVRYRGQGTVLFDSREWFLPGHAALLLVAAPNEAEETNLESAER
jgi:maltooligosyltrehalose trehalohydrolase